MTDRLKEARDLVELSRLLQSKLPCENQPREQIRECLEIAKIHIDEHLDKMDRVDKFKND